MHLAAILLLMSMLPVQPRTAPGSPPQLFRQAPFMQVLQPAIRQMYAAQPDSARHRLAPWKRMQPAHPLWAFWDGFEIWWQIADDLAETRHDDAFYRAMELTTAQCDALLEVQPGHLDALVIKATAHAFAARLAANRAEWFRSLEYTRRSYYALNRIKKVAPDHPDLLFSDGMMMYYAEVLPRRYPLAGRAFAWFADDASAEGGLRKIARAGEHGLFMRYEARYFMANLLMNYEQRPADALAYTQGLAESFPANVFFLRHHMRLLTRLHRWEEAERWAASVAASMAARSPALMEDVLHVRARRAAAYQEPGAAALFEAQMAHSAKLPAGTSRALWVSAAIERARLAHQAGDSGTARTLLTTALAADRTGRRKDEIRNLLKELRS